MALWQIKEALQAKTEGVIFWCGLGLPSLQYNAVVNKFVDEVTGSVKRYGGTEEDLIRVLKWYFKKNAEAMSRNDKTSPSTDGEAKTYTWDLYEAVLSATDAPDDDISFAAAHIGSLKEALPEIGSMKFINFVARVACKLGIPSDRMQMVAEGIASPHQRQDIDEIEVQRFAKLLMEQRDDCKVFLKRLGFCWNNSNILSPPHELELAFAELDYLTELSLHGVGKAETLVGQLLRKPGNNLKLLHLEWSEMTVEGIGRLSSDLASQECQVEELAIMGNNINIGKEGWEEVFKNGIFNKLKTLNLDSLDEEAGEVFFKGLTSPNCSLQTLHIGRWDEEYLGFIEGMCKALEEGTKLSALHLENLPVKNAKRLSEALSSPNCGLEELRLAWLKDDAAVGWLAKALENPNCKLVKLSIDFLRPQEAYSSLWSALSSANCKLRSLEIGTQVIAQNDQPWMCILESSIEDLTIHGDKIERLDDLCKLLEDPKCKLRKFRAPSLRSDAQKGKILAALQENYQSHLEVLEIDRYSEYFKLRCSHLLERNAIFQKSAFREFDNPSTAKLFLCGHGRVGKTTIKNNLCRKVSWFPSCLQRHASTAGIELEPLVFQDTKQKLVICDLAGQEEFHAFHHYFFRGSEKDLFLIVCKVEKGNYEDFKQNLIYWLRFIASHQSASPTRRPKVLIALNFFKSEVDYDPRTLVSNIISDNNYGNVLELGNRVADYCFGVVATQVQTVKGIKIKLQRCLAELLSTQQQIPRQCLKAKRKLIESASKGQRGLKVINIPVQKVGEILLPQRSSQRGDAFESVVKFILQFLHDTGDAIYFGLGHEEDNIVSQFVILDVQWFIRDVVKLFIQPGGAFEGRMETDKVQCQLKMKCGEQEHVVEYALAVLHEMGVILPWDDKWNGNWHRPPIKLVVPTLLKDKYSSSSSSSVAVDIQSHKWWGRRFGCKDKKLKLLPAGIFTMIQVKLHELCKTDFKLGDGWVAFKHNLVNIVVRVGGDTDNWKDRQWVDVIVFLPQQVENRIRPDLEEEAERWMIKIRECIVGICMVCPSLEVKEYVMRRGYVLKRILGAETIPKSWDAVVCSLEEVKCEARAADLNFSHTWNDVNEEEIWDACEVSLSDENSLEKLLMPSEQKSEVGKRLAQLGAILKDYEEVVEEYRVQMVEIPHVTRTPSFEDPDSYSNRDYAKLAKLVKKEGSQIRRHVDDGLDKLKKDLKFMICKVSEVHTSFSKVLLKLEVDCPKYPYFVERNNIFKKYPNLLGTSFKIHYMCEWSGGRFKHEAGAHKVKDSTGVDLDLPHECTCPCMQMARTII